jgi:hypothetical protein
MADVVEQACSDGEHGVFGGEEVGEGEDFRVWGRVLSGVVPFEGRGGGEFALAFVHEAGVTCGIALQKIVVRFDGVLEGVVLSGVSGVAVFGVALEKASRGHFDGLLLEGAMRCCRL